MKWFKRSLVVFLVLLTLAVLGWFTKVYVESRVSGDRGVYLTLPGPHHMTLRWGTAESEVGEVHYGTSARTLTYRVQEPSATRNHRITLTDLQPATRYYYQVKGENGQPDRGAGWFYTTPTDPVSTRVWVLGDPGYPSPEQVQVRDGALHWLRANQRDDRALLDLILTTGDNAYRSGSNAEFIAGFFSPYAGILKHVPVWPVFGNHDARRWTFYQLFDRPRNAESGGVPSNDRAYFSFDHAQVHFVILDSQHGDMRPGSEMLNWLKDDLAATQKKWIVALLHHPPYSKGIHNSDDEGDSRGRMIQVRENVVPILENGGVDLLLAGHSHNYERSHLLHCHYDTSPTFTPQHIKATHVIDTHGIKRYQKSAARNRQLSGTMYSVVGSSAKLDSGIALDHPAMAISLAERGSLMLDFASNTLEGRFISQTGEITDHFIIEKKVITTPGIKSCDQLTQGTITQ